MNFDFLKPLNDWSQLYDYCNEAETLCVSKPSFAVVAMRQAMEYLVKHIYFSYCCKSFSVLSDSKPVFDILCDQKFQDLFEDAYLINCLHIVRKEGNKAAHGDSIDEDSAINTLKNLHFAVGEILVNVGEIDDYPEFVNPKDNKTNVITTPKQMPVSDDEVPVSKDLVTKLVSSLKKTKFTIVHNNSELINERLFLESNMVDANWRIAKQENYIFPSSVGVNMMIDASTLCDYVYYGDDGKPLAIVELTETKKNVVLGRKKAEEVAEKLKTRFGYLPLIYYTNGFYIYFIDQLGFPPRRVLTFHTKDEMLLLLNRKHLRKDISNPSINLNITDRNYQIEAIKAVCNAYQSNRRRSLIALATGTGKTRVAVETVEILINNGWVKNVLFLADRTSLVNQAHKVFNSLLPNLPTSVYTGTSFERDPKARVILSTYQTMIGLINEEEKYFSIGRFDLIIVDEAHRSIFNQYGMIFRYFDAMLLGLTATPRGDQDKSTYEVFDIKNAIPDYEYGLDKAVNEHYLVGFSIIDKTSKVLKRGICYDDLSDEEKDKFEKAYKMAKNITDITDPDLELPAEEEGDMFESLNLSGKIINIPTIDLMLNDLMTNGLKVDNGDKIGKTIIYAKSHNEAVEIEKRFKHLYPNLGDGFCKLIDATETESQYFIDRFTEREHLPQVAVTVSLLDTGIDVPDILNLVFFSAIKSKIRFLQMIGRGTRLSKDIFGPGNDKKGFFIFDYYDNFSFFSQKGNWYTTVGDGAHKDEKGKSLSNKYFNNLISLLCEIELNESSADFDKQYYEERLADYTDRVNHLINDNVAVSRVMQYVIKFRDAENYKYLYRVKDQLINYINPLLSLDTMNAKTKWFDYLMMSIERCGYDISVNGLDSKAIPNRDKIILNADRTFRRMNEDFHSISTIPQVAKLMNIIDNLKSTETLFENYSLEYCEEVRKALRDVVVLLPDRNEYYVFYIADDLVDDVDIVIEPSYLEKMMEYIGNGDPVFSKINNLEELDDNDKKHLKDVFFKQLGTEEDFKRTTNGAQLFVFLRANIGISDEAIEAKFGSFLNDEVFDEKQLEYCYQMIQYVRQNGDITGNVLANEKPFSDESAYDLFGEKLKYVKELLDGLHKPIVED